MYQEEAGNPSLRGAGVMTANSDYVAKNLASQRANDVANSPYQGRTLTDAAQRFGENVINMRGQRQQLEVVLQKLRGAVPMPESSEKLVGKTPDINLSLVFNGLSIEQSREISLMQKALDELSSVLGSL